MIFKNLYIMVMLIVVVKKADRYSARPRHSEHELGLALDIVTIILQWMNLNKPKNLDG